MIPITIRDLAAITAGQVRQGHPPPLSGLDEPLIGRVVTNVEQVNEGDLFWQPAFSEAAPTADSETNAWAVAEATAAFSRGAAGVVSQSSQVQPWAGTFTLQVADASWALWQLAKESRQQFAGRVIGMPGDEVSTTCHLIRELLSEPSLPSPENTDALSFTALQLINQSTTRSLTLPLATECTTQLDSLMHLAQPDFFVDEGKLVHDATSLFELLACLPDDGVLIVGNDLRSYARREHGGSRHGHGCRIVSVGRHIRSAVRATGVEFQDDTLSFSVEGCRVRLPGLTRNDLNLVLSAWAIARTFGITDSEISRRFHAISKVQQKVRRTEVDGIAVIHDTSSHTCDTWLAALSHGGEFAGQGTPRLAIHNPNRDTTFRSGGFGSKHVVVNCTARSDSQTVSPQLSNDWNQLAAAIVQKCGADTLFAFGPLARPLVQQSIKLGMPRNQTFALASRFELADKLHNVTQRGDLVVILGDDAEILTTNQTTTNSPQQTSNKKAA